MLRNPQFFKQIVSRHSVQNQLRNYNYQTEVYTKKFESIDENLKKDLQNVNVHRVKQPNLYRYISAYRQYGFKNAQVNPLDQYVNFDNYASELDPKTYGLSRDSTAYSTQGLIHAAGTDQMTVDQIESYLKNTYADKACIEFDFLSSLEEKLWIEKRFEEIQSQSIEQKTQIEILNLLLKSQVKFDIYFFKFKNKIFIYFIQAFDFFLASKFPSFKRYSLEGGESAMAFYYSIFSNLAKSDVEQLVMGIAHRGRLNLMACLLNLDPVLLFAKVLLFFLIFYKSRFLPILK